MSAAASFDMLKYFFFRPAFAIRPVGTKGIPDINQSEITRCQWKLITLQFVRIAGTIPFFVVTVWNLECGMQIGNRPEYTTGIGWILAHYNPLLIGKFTGFEQN